MYMENRELSSKLEIFLPGLAQIGFPGLRR